MNRQDRRTAHTEEEHPRVSSEHRHRPRPKWGLLIAIGAAAVLLVAGAAWGAWALLRPKGPAPVMANPPAAGRAAVKPNAALVAAVNGFGFDLLRRTSEANPGSPSVVLSPLSIHTTLAMAETGARNTTSAHMRNVLKIDAIKPAAEHQDYADLLASLGESEQGQFAIANSIWVDKNKEFLQPFLDINRQYFGAQVSAVDLHSKSGVDEINSWVSKNTGDRIARLLDSPLPASASMEILNAAYFLGTWKTSFDAHATKLADFNVPTGPAVMTQMMAVSGSFEHTKTATYEAISLPYKGGKASMVVVLPSAKSSMSRLLKTLDAAHFAKLVDGLAKSDGSLNLPKLETRGSLQLRNQLSAMGMSDAFSTSRADFSGMTKTTPTWIDRVQHSTYLRVDEQGTEAAAATAVSVGITAVAPHSPFQMTVDRPYLIAIVDERSGAILFLAAVQDPRG